MFLPNMLEGYKIFKLTNFYHLKIHNIKKNIQTLLNLLIVALPIVNIS